MPVQWADVGSVETLETLVADGNRLHGILMARLRDRSYREESLGNWLIGSYGAKALAPKPASQEEVRRDCRTGTSGGSFPSS